MSQPTAENPTIKNESEIKSSTVDANANALKLAAAESAARSTLALLSSVPHIPSTFPPLNPALTDVSFPLTSNPLFHHLGVQLSGVDGAALGECLSELLALGYDYSDPRFSRLFQLFQFLLLYNFRSTEHRGRQLTQQLTQENSIRNQFQLFNGAQYRQFLIQIKALQSIVAQQPIDTKVLMALQGFAYDKKTQQASHWLNNPKQVETVNAVLAASKAGDPCSSIVELTSIQFAHGRFPESLIRQERDKYTSRLINQRKQRLDELQAEYERKNQSPPFALRFERLSYDTLKLQSELRNRVWHSLPLEMHLRGQFRSRKAIDIEGRKRDKLVRQLRNREEKESKQFRKNYLSLIFNHTKEFMNFHRERRKIFKKISDGIAKEFEDESKKKEADGKQVEKQRLAALKENNEEEYMRLLKEAKNERLLQLIRQTDNYMLQIGAKLKAEHENNRLDDKSEFDDAAEKMKIDGGDDSVEGGDSKILSRNEYYSMVHSITEVNVAQPTSLVFGKLRDYQMRGLSWLVSLYNNQLNGILADEMGLGKTVQSCALIAHLMESKKNYGPFLIIAPMSTLHNNWEMEFDRWFPTCQKVIYDGNKEQRKFIKDKYIKTGNYNVLMTTFEFAMRDKSILRKVNWEYIIIDEAHRLKNIKCKLAQELATYSPKSRRVALTGTPLQNDLTELWALLNFLHPKIFNSSENFERWFSSPISSVSGSPDAVEMSEEERLLVINRLHSILRPFMLRREKREVERDLADKVEKVLRCDLSPVQKIMYETVLSGRISLHNRMVQMRKICNSPLLFHPYVRNVNNAMSYDVDESLIQVCGKLALLDQILAKLKRTGHRVLIFNQMTKTMNILEDYFRLREYKFLRLDGNTETADRSAALKAYQAEDSDYFIFILSTRAGGLGLNLQSADTVILFDSDWNPMNDAQAMARSHRIGQKQQVLVLRLITAGTVEEKVLATATTKLNAEQMVIQAGMFHDHYSDTQSRALMEQAIRAEGLEGSDLADDDDPADELSKALARTEEELKIFQAMDDADRIKINRKQLSRSLPDYFIPRWVTEWALKGSKATESGCDLIPFSRKQLFEKRLKMFDRSTGEAENYEILKADFEKAPDDRNLLTASGREAAARKRRDELARLAKIKADLREKLKNEKDLEEELEELPDEEFDGDGEAANAAAEAKKKLDLKLNYRFEEDEDFDPDNSEEEEEGKIQSKSANSNSNSSNNNNNHNNNPNSSTLSIPIPPNSSRKRKASPSKKEEFVDIGGDDELRTTNSMNSNSNSNSHLNNNISCVKLVGSTESPQKQLYFQKDSKRIILKFKR